MPNVASFDVFDTVLTRAVGSPESVFLVLGRYLCRRSLLPGMPDTFVRARLEAENRAYRNAGDWCTVTTIYAELAAALQWTDAQRDQVMELECAFEEAFTRAVPRMRDRIEEARAQGYRVVFASDTYLLINFVRQLLIRHELYEEGDGCYVSSACGKSKRSSDLFTEIVRQEGISADLVTHHGNSLALDGRSSVRAGLRFSPFPQGNLNRYEQLLEGHAAATEGLTSAMAGASRLARLSVSTADGKQEALRDVAAGVAAPTLVGYVLWVLHRATELGLERLYFLSRDGQVLLDIARRLAKSLNLPVELRYLYGSRQSWNLPAISGSGEKELAWIWDTTDDLSVRSLLARVGVEPEWVKNCLESAGLPSAGWSRSLGARERRLLRQVLGLPELQTQIARQACAKRRCLLDYLAQQGVLDKGKWGIVDLGWHGSMQNSLASLVAGRGGTPPIGFYFALFQGAIVDACTQHREAYYLDERQGWGFLNAVPELIPLLEMFCAGDHGTVVDFVERDGRAVPVLREESNQAVIDWGLPRVRETIARFVDGLVLDAELVNPWADARGAITEVLRAFWTKPTSDEAQSWSSFPWEDGLGSQTQANPLAQAYRWQDVARALRVGRVPPHHRASWLAGSLVLSPRAVRVALGTLTRARRRFPFLRACLDRYGQLLARS